MRLVRKDRRELRDQRAQLVQPELKGLRVQLALKVPRAMPDRQA